MSTYTDGKTGNTLSYAARDKSGHLSFFKFDRQEPGASDVEFRIEFCGICHSDLHQIRGEWGGEFWPMVPGPWRELELSRPCVHPRQQAASLI